MHYPRQPVLPKACWKVRALAQDQTTPGSSEIWKILLQSQTLAPFKEALYYHFLKCNKFYNMRGSSSHVYSNMSSMLPLFFHHITVRDGKEKLLGTRLLKQLVLKSNILHPGYQLKLSIGRQQLRPLVFIYLY